MKRISLFSIFLLILSGFLSSGMLAQDQGSVRGQLGGVVGDPTGAIIQGATVTITGPTGTAERMSNDSGEFNFPGLIPGFYDVKVTKDGFKGTTVQKVEVLINKTSTIKVNLELGAVTQTVEVVASAVSVESQSAAVTADISDTVYNNLPLARSITSTFYLSPGVTSGLGTGVENPAISGGTGLENAYIADGVLLNDAAFGGLGVYHRRYGGLGVGINSSFVKEVQVNTAAFGPQYGHTTGGVINMVTKSGGTSYHGVVGGYFQSESMSATYQNQDDFNPVNKIGKEIAPRAYEGDFELGGFVPLGALKNHLFFFGAFNPTWNDSFVQPVPGTGLFTSTNGVVDRKDTIWDYSAKLTWQLNSNHAIEASVFGDPTHSNFAPWSTLNINNTTADSTQTYGGRNLAVRYNGIFGSSLVVDAAFTLNWVSFFEAPANVPQITDLTQTAPGEIGSFRAQGFGSFETDTSNSKGIQFDVHKEFTFLGQHHTISVGYNWQFPTFDDSNTYSGPLFPIASVNVAGQPYIVGASNQAAVANQSANVSLELELAPSTCTLCPYMNLPNPANPSVSIPQQVMLQQTRGVFSGFTSDNTAKYHAAYINDSWEINKHATLEAGFRWEQQRIASGNGIAQLMNDQWDPRIGFTVDPKGDRKTKIYANFARYAWVMPLDAAIREISDQEQVENVYYAPVSANCSNGTCGPASPSDLVTLNTYNTVTFDPKNVLNNAPGGIKANPQVLLVSGGGVSSPFAPGTKMEYNDEVVVGAEHEFRGGITGSIRYVDRRIKRIIEDYNSISLEQGLAGVGGAYFIGNPNAMTDATTNPKPYVFSQGAFFSGSLPAQCLDSNGNPTPYVALNVQTSIQAENGSAGGALGSVCYPSINDNPWTTSTGSLIKGALFGGEPTPDGQPDGYLNPERTYQAVEIEVNKSFSHNWSLLSNWRISKLYGNFEGAFRNDNRQNDPGISSLYDYTPGVLNVLAAQLTPGLLNADRTHIVNIYPTYIFDKTFFRGLIITPGVKIQTGIPLTTLLAQQIYVLPGEIPMFGRGNLGRSPTTGTVDLHLEYPWKLSETKALHFSIDMLNLFDTRRNLSVDQDVDLSYGVKNSDFMLPAGAYGNNLNAAGSNLTAGFVQPFSARFHVSFTF